VAKKKAQHIIPQIHLRQFTTGLREGQPAGRPVAPFVWLVPKDLVTPSVARAPRNAFVVTRAYNLRADDPSDPWLEGALAKLEGAYGATLPRLRDGAEPNEQDWAAVVLFVGALRARTLTDIGHWQSIFARVEHLHRQVEQAHTGAQAVSDKRFAAGTEMSKYHLPGRVEGYANVVAPGGWLLRNESQVDFVSADIPVAHHFLHPDELLRLGLPSEWIVQGATPADRAFVSVCALTPRLLFLSSPLLLASVDSIYRTTSTPATVLGLNELIRASANTTLIARSPNPYGSMQSIIVSIDKHVASNAPTTEYVLQIYTPTNRHRIDATTFQHDHGPHPLEFVMRFRTGQLDELRSLASECEVVEVTAYHNGSETGGMRGGILTTVALDPSAETVIEHSPLRWPTAMKR
jgi:hypothetical protein